MSNYGLQVHKNSRDSFIYLSFMFIFIPLLLLFNESDRGHEFHDQQLLQHPFLHRRSLHRDNVARAHLLFYFYYILNFFMAQTLPAHFVPNEQNYQIYFICNRSKLFSQPTHNHFFVFVLTLKPTPLNSNRSQGRSSLSMPMAIHYYRICSFESVYAIIYHIIYFRSIDLMRVEEFY